MRLNPFALFCVFCLFCLPLKAQNGYPAYWDYIEEYKDLAIEQMERHRIPASITLAQGLLESGAGRSRLARKANNHFGIKVSSGWNGPYVLADDDAPNERFRKYRNVRESYEDHSDFLKRPRYASLFNLKITDYKGWAKGLKRCGYATSSTYASKLIDLIETYNLAQFDKKRTYRRKQKSNNTVEVVTSGALPLDFYADHIVYRNNDNYYIVVQSGDNLAAIAEETGVSVRRLLRYNELPGDHVPTVGDILYLKKKRRKADKQFKRRPHTVQVGESMYGIAQHYGIRLESLYKMNDLDEGYGARPGDQLRVR